jgi:hypothetical protein
MQFSLEQFEKVGTILKEAKMNRDEAIQKVIKLLSLSKSDNPHEAALAAQRAQEILDRYEISQFMLDGTITEDIQDFSKQGEYLEKCKGKQLQTWKSYLSAVVSTANGCKTFVRWEWDVKKQKEIAMLHLVGRCSDAQKVRYLYAFLTNEVNRLTDRDGKKKGKSWRNNFRLGVVDTVKKALREGKQKLATDLHRENKNSSTALIRVDQAIAKLYERSNEVNKWMQDHLDMKEKAPPKIFFDPRARAAGQQAGKEINLHTKKSLNPAKKMLVSLSS